VAEFAALALDSAAAIPLGPQFEESGAHSRARRTSVAALVASGAGDPVRIERWLQDPDRLLRREATLGLNTVREPEARRLLLEMALDDRSPEVRYEALRIRFTEGTTGCTAALAAMDDGAPHITLLAIDRIASCPVGSGATVALDSVARMLGPSGWPAPSRALLALASRDAEQARELIPAFVAHSDPFVRVDAALAAARLGDALLLQELLEDRVPNVRSAAIDGLAAVEGRAADELLLVQLEARPDSGSPGAHRLDPAPQVAMSVSRALTGSPHPQAPAKLFLALQRLTEQASESSGDARVALLRRLAELGDAPLVPRIEPYLTDFDPRVADAAADALERWTGSRPEPRPVPLPTTQLPSFAELAALEGARVVLELSGGGRVEVLLDPFLAPTNSWRFARLAESGAFGGLTFHRVVPNFVVQGGSPDANEYAGYERFTRDEIGSDGNWRGTVGTSTRGHDTGDGQIYVNLVDNLRLDHQYTVFGRVVRGMEALATLTAGAVIERARVIRR